MTVSTSKIYTFKYVAQNALGLSEDSDLLQVAIAGPPNTPSMPTFVVAECNRTQITLQWDSGTSPDTPVTGYRLYSDLGLNGDYFLVYDGAGNTNKLQFTHSRLESGLIYSY